MIRLSKRIAQTGLFSRREADRLISQGFVTVDNITAVPGTQVPEEGGRIMVKGKLLGEKSNAVYKFNKPKLVLSSYSDPNGKHNLSEFKELANMKLGYSGRLDYDSEGLMLFTADGGLIYRLQRSEYGVEKEYDVTTDTDLSSNWITRLRGGITSYGEEFLPCIVKKKGTCRYTVILIEGKKRQVKRMFAEAGVKVSRLVRVRIGSVTLGNTAPGSLKQLTEDEVKELEKCIKSK